VTVALWDTTVASRLHPQGELFAQVREQAIGGVPVRVAAPAVLEVAYGYQRMAANDVRYRHLLGWFTGLLDQQTVTVVPLDGRAALVAGRLRAMLPHPPARRDRRSKTMRQAAWLLDVEIAATAFAAGLDVATENRADFELLSDALGELFPAAPPLAVVAPSRRRARGAGQRSTRTGVPGSTRAWSQARTALSARMQPCERAEPSGSTSEAGPRPWSATRPGPPP
jgi:predicted nucleic acid-binding protein